MTTGEFDPLVRAMQAIAANEVQKALTASGLSAGALNPGQASALATTVVARKRYTALDQLPEAVRALPEPAQRLFMQEFNDNFSEGEAGEETAFRAAWKKVRAHYQRTAEGWVEKSVTGANEGDVDRLRKQLITDGYIELADRIALAAKGLVFLADADFAELPAGYRAPIMRRFLHARKDIDLESFQIEVAFKALLPEKQITYGVVYPAYPPGEGDLQKERAEADVIEEAAHRFLADYRAQDKFHDEQAGAGVPVESFIAPADLTEFHGQLLKEVIPRGSWIMATKWTDDAWNLVKTGQIKGYSIGGYKRIRRR
jgi:cation transport regulator ChaB